ncbi:MAG: CHASE domain-containing protein, partial [Vicinamibacterales bacterium]
MEQTSARSAPIGMFGAAPWLVLALGLSATTAAALYIRAAGEAGEAGERLRVRAEVQRAADQISHRLKTYSGELEAVAAWFATNERADGARFRAYVERLNLQDQYRGIQTIGFSRRLRPADLEAVVGARRAEGHPAFRIWPEGEREAYDPILYVEPLNRRTESTLGFDMSTDPARRAAMERAVQTGRAAASGKLRVIQEVDAEEQTGFLIYAPVFQQSVSGAVDAASTLTGFVHTTFRVDQLLGEILGPDGTLELFVFDGATLDGTALLHGPALEPGVKVQPPGALSARVDVAGRPWTVIVRPRAGAALPTEARFLPWVVVGGTMISLVLFGLSRAQVRAQSTAQGVLDDLRASEEHLRESEGRYRFLFDGNPQPLWVYDTDTYEFLTVNAAATATYGYSREEFLRMRILDLHPAKDTTALKARLAELGHGLGPPSEWRHRRRDGRVIDVAMVSHPLAYQGRSARIVSATDITARKRAEDELRQAQQVLEQRVQERTQALEQSRRELAESQRELRDYVDHMSTLNAKVAPDGRLLLVNRVAQAASGLPL